MDCDGGLSDPDLPNHGNPKEAPWATQEDNQMETNTPANSAPMAEYPSLTAETQSKPKKVTTNGHQTPREKPTTPLLKPNPPNQSPPSIRPDPTHQDRINNEGK